MPRSDSAVHRESAPQAVLDLLSRYETAFNANDPDTMASLFTEDCTFVNFGGAVALGRSDLHRAQSQVFAAGGPLEAVEVTYSPEHATLLGADHAVVHARQRTMTPNGGILSDDPMEAVFTLVLARTDEGWRIRMGQNTPVRTSGEVEDQPAADATGLEHAVRTVRLRRRQDLRHPQ